MHHSNFSVMCRFKSVAHTSSNSLYQRNFFNFLTYHILVCSLFTCTTNHAYQTYHTHFMTGTCIYQLVEKAKFDLLYSKKKSQTTSSYHCSTSSISLASVFSSVSRKHFTRVSQVKGPWPFPPIHFCKMASLISSASCIFARSMPETIVPLSS